MVHIIDSMRFGRKQVVNCVCRNSDVSPQQTRLGFLIRTAGFLICLLSFPINLLCIYSGFLWTEEENMKHPRCATMFIFDKENHLVTHLEAELLLI